MRLHCSIWARLHRLVALRSNNVVSVASDRYNWLRCQPLVWSSFGFSIWQRQLRRRGQCTECTSPDRHAGQFSSAFHREVLVWRKRFPSRVSRSLLVAESSGIDYRLFRPSKKFQVWCSLGSGIHHESYGPPVACYHSTPVSMGLVGDQFLHSVET